MAERRRILIWISSHNAHGRAALLGIYRYARHREDWDLVRGMEPTEDAIGPALAGVSGVIAFVDNVRLAKRLKGLRVPVVNIASSLRLEEVPGVSVVNDNRAIGRMAAEHFLERGYRQFAFVGVRGRAFSDEREAGFAEALGRQGLKFTKSHRSGELRADRAQWYETEPHLRSFIRGLAPHTAVFGVVDPVSIIVAVYARRIGRAIPEDLAILGANNDELLCESITPPLSSIKTGGEQVGFRSAEMLANLLDGAAMPATRVVQVPPLGVETRMSSDTLAVEDELVSAALGFIRSRVEVPTSVDDVLDHLVVSRKTLERRFAEHLRRTPLEEIHRVHIGRAQSLLTLTDLSVGDVSKRSGFVRPEHMATLFRKATGLTPTEYRQQFRTR